MNRTRFLQSALVLEAFCKHRKKDLTMLLPKIRLLKTSDLDQRNETSRPIVLFWPWLGAGTRAVQKYSTIYTNRGLDVLVIQATPTDFLWPSNAVLMADELSSWLEARTEYDQYVVHTMSVGTFMYAAFSMRVHDEHRTWLIRRIQGQVFDSPFIGSSQRMAEGTANGVTNFKPARWLITALVLGYLKLTKSYTQDIHEEALERLTQFPVRTSTLVFFSQDDPMCDAGYLHERVLKPWASGWMPRFAVGEWQSSTHAAHLLRHEHEYMRLWTEFMDALPLSTAPLRHKL